MILTTDNPVIPQYLHIWIKQIDRGLSMAITTFIMTVINRSLFELAIPLKFK